VTPWYRQRAALAFIGKRYLPVLGGLNLVWETTQLPLYTVWREASAGYVAFALAHCTVGDLLIGAAAFVFALTATRAGPPAAWRWKAIGLLATLAGVAYTAVSEWLNTARLAWQYSDLMPTLQIGRGSIGLAPLAQWLVLPPLALGLARRSRGRAADLRDSPPRP
jgi:hypothetical protein